MSSKFLNGFYSTSRLAGFDFPPNLPVDVPPWPVVCIVVFAGFVVAVTFALAVFSGLAFFASYAFALAGSGSFWGIFLFTMRSFSNGPSY
jgi:hypothetical protein